MKNDSIMNSNQQKTYRSFRMGLALIFTLLLFFNAQTALAESLWSVEGSTSGTTTTFTIKRSDATMDEKVLYRTVSLSALEDGNFYRRVGRLTFEAGKTEKTVSVPEIASPKNGFMYQTSGKRSYRFEVTDEGGFYLASADRSYSTGDSIPSFLMQMKDIAVKNEVTVTDDGYAQAYHNIDFSTFSSDSVKSYLNYIGAELRMTLTFDAREKNDGYQYVQIYANTPADDDHTDTGAEEGYPGKHNFVRYAAGFSIDGNGKETYYSYTFPVLAYGHACGKVSQPWNGNNSYLQQQYFTNEGRANDGRVILPTSLSNLYVRLNASGNNSDTWYAKNIVAHLQAVDTIAPTSIRNGTIVAGQQFAHGNTVYVSVSFKEIVTISGDKRQLHTSWGDLDYIDGSGSNVLTFGGTISDDATGKLSVKGYEGDIADLAGKAFSGSLSFYSESSITESHAYPISYDLGKGANNGNNPTTYTYDNSVTIGSPIRPGCRFLGWTGSNGSTPQTSVKIPAHSHGPRHYTAVWEDFWAVEQGADGSAEHPFIITTPDGLNHLAEMVNKGNSFKDFYFRLGANIDMSGVDYFEPIGTVNESGSFPFSGNFDGQGYSISNLTVSFSILQYIGLFGYIDEGASVSNIVLVDANIENNSTNGYAGAVVGITKNGYVSGNLVLGGRVKARNSDIPLIGEFSDTPHINDVRASAGHYRNVKHKGSTVSDIFTLALPNGITATAVPAATWEGTKYYTKGTEVTLSGASPATTTGGVTYGASYVVSYDRSDYYMADVDGKATFAMPSSDVTVSTENYNSVTYIDEDGNEQTAYNVTLIESRNGNVTLGADGKTNWYAVTGDVVIKGKIRFDNSHTHLIICDGASLTVTDNSGIMCTIDGGNNDITIYGQSLGSGSLTVNSDYDGILANNITINSGNIDVTAENRGIYGNTVTINGGNINVAGGEGVSGIDGGTITLGWSSLDDRIFASSYSGTVQIKNGQFFYNGSDVFSGTIIDNSTVSGKTLAPYYPMVTFDAQNGSEPTTVLASYENGYWIVTAPATPTRSGYKFLGWFTSKDGDTEFDVTAPVTQRVTVVYAKWMENIPIEYVDENGKKQTITDYTMLTGDESEIGAKNTEKWYVVNGNVNMSELTCIGTINLVLMDDAKLTISQYLNGNEIKVYGQSGGSGVLEAAILGVEESTINGGVVNVKNEFSGHGHDVTINGGVVNVDGKFKEKNITINGGNVSSDEMEIDWNFNVTGGNVTVSENIQAAYIYIEGGHVTVAKDIECSKTYFNGGNLTVTGEIDGELYFDWANSTDSITVGRYWGVLTITEGKYFTDGEGNVYSGEIDSNLDGKTLTPCYAVTLDAQNGNTPTMIPATFDENGNAYAAVPAAPIRSGYKFLGWFTTADGDTEFDFRAAVTASVIVYAKWVKNIPIEYVDEKGETQSIAEYIELTSATDVSNLPSGWYAVLGKVDLKNTVEFSGDAHLILAKGAEMNVDVTSGVAIEALGNLTIYGQSGQSGALNASSTNGDALQVGDLSINGGNVTAMGGNEGIHGNSITITGGNVTAIGEYYGIYGNTITLGWTNSTDRIKANRYSGSVFIANGKSLKTNEKMLVGMVNDFDDINGKTLVPSSFDGKFLSNASIVVADIPVQNYKNGESVCPNSITVIDGKDTLKAGTDYTFACFNNSDVTSTTLDYAAPYVEITGMGNYAGEIQKRFFIWKNIGDYAAVQVFEDADGKTHAEIDGEYTGDKTIEIPDAINVKSIEFNREFTPGVPATVMLPFELPDEATVNAKFYELTDVAVENNTWMATMTNINLLDKYKVKLPKANTPYAVILNNSATDGRLVFDLNGKMAKVHTNNIDSTWNGDKKTWYFKGTYSYKVWKSGDSEIGLAYAFAGSNDGGVAQGSFGRIAANASACAMRSYLRKRDASVTVKNPLGSSSIARYGINSLPATIDVKFVDEDENESGKRTTVIGHMDSRTGEIRLEPRTKRTYDLKGRRVNREKQNARGAYYGKNVRK